MRLNYSDLKTGFKEYLDELNLSSGKSTTLNETSIFSNFTEFKEYLRSELHINPKEISANLGDLTQIVIENGKVISLEEEKEQQEELNQDENTENDEDIAKEDAKIENSDKPEEETSEIDSEYEDEDEENQISSSFFSDLLKDIFSSQESDKLDINQDGKIDNEDIISLIQLSAMQDSDENNLTLDELLTSFEDISITEDETDIEETVEDDTVDSTSSDTNTSSASSSSSSSSGGGSSSSGSSSSSSSSASDSSEAKEVDYTAMKFDKLKEEKAKQESTVTTNQNNLNEIYSGQNSQINSKQEALNELQKSYEDALNEDENIDSDTRKKITENNQNIAQKEQDIDTTNAAISENEANLLDCNNKITEYQTNISALETTIQQLSAEDSDNSKISELEAQKQEMQAQYDELVAKKPELEQKQTELKEQLETQKQELEELKTTKDELDEQINEKASDATKQALKAYNTAKESFDKFKDSAISTAKSELDESIETLSKINEAYNARLEKQTLKENGVSTSAPLFDADTEYTMTEITEVSDGSMKYLVIGPSNADPDEELPVMVFLHCKGGGNNFENLEGGSFITALMNNGGETFNGYIICPLNESNDEWSADAVKATVEDFAQTHAIDRDNIALTGHSRGGAVAVNFAAADTEGYYSSVASLSGYTPNADTLRSISVPFYGYSGYQIDGQVENPVDEYMQAAFGNTDNYTRVNSNHDGVPGQVFGINSISDSDGDNQLDIFKKLFPDLV